MDQVLHHATHGSFATLTADITTFVAGYSIASTEAPILQTAKVCMIAIADILPAAISPSQPVIDEIVRMGAALVVSIISRLIIKIFDNKKTDTNATKKESNRKKESSPEKEASNESEKK
jgi:mannitol-specific phosphotransferase system IIBC component